jgi:hypothetical protein
MLDAADYVRSNGRREARRAIVILTDDETEFNRDEDGVQRALTRADAVMFALIAPNAMRYRSGGSGGGRYPQGGGYPGSGGGGLGGVIFGQPRGPYGGRGGGPQTAGRRTKSAGTSEIARQSGGDSMPVDGAYALEDTLSRIRQRYALHFMLPAGARAGDQRSLSVSLSDAALRRYPYADVRYRREYYVPSGVIPSQSSPETTVSSRSGPASDPDRPIQRRRGVSQNDGDSPVPNMRPPEPAAPAQASSPTTAAPAAQPTPQQQPAGRWRKVAPSEQQQQQ